MRERALKLVERHAGKTRAAVRDELIVAADQLIPALRARAVGVLGAAPAASRTVVHEEMLPPAPEPARLAPAPGSAAELAEEVWALLVSGGDVATFERTLDGLAESVRAAAATGAYATIWGLLLHTLPVLLAVAAECGERSGARGELPHLARVAGRRGSSRLVTQARRLHDALALERPLDGRTHAPSVSA
ncbi:hypothetical protein [Streptomyces sp. NPDC051001]|uniref:hypothetical protein n=1 Tax=Streptomyces sp. NPDC051001 TaxID=3155795 RepID=UPI003447281C